MTIPAGGLEVQFGNGFVRAQVVQVDEALLPDFARIAGEGSGETRTFSAAQWNTAVVEFWSLASVIADPGTNILVAPAGSSDPARVRFPHRVRDALLSSRSRVGLDTEGAPVIGLPLVVTREHVRDLDPSREGISAEESERRSWALAVYEQTALLGERAVLRAAPVERSGGVHPAFWAAGVVLVGVGIYAVVTAINDRAEVNAQLARDTAVIAAGARAYEQRLLQFRQSGTMPEASEAERAARVIVDQRANQGWTRLSQAASEVLRDTGKTVNTVLKWSALGLGFYLLSPKAG